MVANLLVVERRDAVEAQQKVSWVVTRGKKWRNEKRLCLVLKSIKSFEGWMDAQVSIKIL